MAMMGLKKVMGVRSVDDVQEQAVREFITNHPELAEQVGENLRGEQGTIDMALADLDGVRTNQE